MAFDICGKRGIACFGFFHIIDGVVRSIFGKNIGEKKFEMCFHDGGMSVLKGQMIPVSDDLIGKSQERVSELDGIPTEEL
jgi:hypothetical protein